MKDKDTELIWETHKTFQTKGNVPQADHNPDATMYGKPVKDMVPTVAGLDKKYGKKELSEEIEFKDYQGRPIEPGDIVKLDHYDARYIVIGFADNAVEIAELGDQDTVDPRHLNVISKL